MLQDNLALIEVTLRSLKSRKPQEFQHMVDQFVQARTRYVKLNFKETCTILQNCKETPIKKLASLLAWLDQCSQREETIYQRLGLPIEWCTEQVFDSSFLKIVKKNVDAEIKAV